MDLALVLDMVMDGLGDSVLVGSADGGLTGRELGARALGLAGYLRQRGIDRLGFVDVSSEVLPVALYGAVVAGAAFVPCNFRLADDQLRRLVARMAPALVVVGEGGAERVEGIRGIEVLDREELLDVALTSSGADARIQSDMGELPGVLLYTSGTTGEPKAAVLRQRNLAAYVLGAVELGSGVGEVQLISVPPYHVAGVASVLTSSFAGRRIVYLAGFDAHEWVDTVDREGVTHAMVVPTMLHRILEVLRARDTTMPTLQVLSYGGGPMPRGVIEEALLRLPHVGFVNAYGLTETASTIALLDPEDHRQAFASSDPLVRARLYSVGRPLPTVEVTVRDTSGQVLPPGERGEIWVRGDQVAGEYVGQDTAVVQGWFRTRDEGHVDGDGYLFVHGRLDDVIVRGGENIAPAEVEEVLSTHPAVERCAVVGLPDREWGHVVVAAVVARQAVTAEELQQHIRQRLRSSRTPEAVVFVDELPYNESGKLLRRVVRDLVSDALHRGESMPVASR
jgi:fatty-acyl-CoA synthase